MADKELLDLPAAAALTGAEALLLVQAGNSRRAALTALVPWLAGELGSSVLLDVDLDATLAANSDTLLASQKAVRTFVAAQIAAAVGSLVNSAPGTLDTLGEIAAALAADEGALAALTGTVAGKAAKAANLGDLADAVAAGANVRPLEYLEIALSDEATAITVGAGKASWFMGYDFTITGIYIGAGAAVSSANATTVDVLRNGASILTTKPSIGSGQRTSLAGAGSVAAVVGTPGSAKGDWFSASIDAAGTGLKGLKLILTGHRTA